jgi:hypothetical protein
MVIGQQPGFAGLAEGLLGVLGGDGLLGRQRWFGAHMGRLWAVLWMALALGCSVVWADCMTVHPQDSFLCARYLTYTNVYVSSNPNALMYTVTLMQTFLTTFIDPTSSYRCACLGSLLFASSQFPFL